MNIAVFDTHPFDQEALTEANRTSGHRLAFFNVILASDTTALAKGFECVCVFVHDRLDAATLELLGRNGIRLVLLRCTGFNNVDLATAARLGIRVARVPEYSPYAVAEHAMALLLALNRKIPRAHARVRDNNFSLDGLVGFDLHGKTVGVVGTGKIGAAFTRIARGFGCRLLGYDRRIDATLRKETGIAYVPLDELLEQSNVVSLHLPLCPETFHLLGEKALLRMKRGAILVNTGRGGLVDALALVEALKSGHLGGAALDVYEEEEKIFFRDLSGQLLQDEVLARLIGFPNVLITAHQGFLTREALDEIARTTLANATAFAEGKPLRHALD